MNRRLRPPLYWMYPPPCGGCLERHWEQKRFGPAFLIRVNKTNLRGFEYPDYCSALLRIKQYFVIKDGISMRSDAVRQVFRFGMGGT